MSPQRQIFQTSSRFRWNAYKWTTRLVLFFLALMIPIVWIALARDHKPFLPGLSKVGTTKSPLIQPKGFTKKEEKKYQGFDAFLKVKQQNALLAASESKKPQTSRIRAAFYVDWDPQALFSLRTHINELNTVMPEWFFIDPVTDTLVVNIDADAMDT